MNKRAILFQCVLFVFALFFGIDCIGTSHSEAGETGCVITILDDPSTSSPTDISCNITSKSSDEVNVAGGSCPITLVGQRSSNEVSEPVPVTCGEGQGVSYCYTNNETSSFLYQSPNEEPVIIFFESGLIYNGTNTGGGDFIRIYDGTNTTGELLFDSDNGSGDLTGVTATAYSGSLLLLASTDDFLSCATGGFGASEWHYLVGCGEFDFPGCTNPEALNFTPEATVDNGSCIYPAENDEPCGAIVLECNEEVVEGNFLGATETVGDACPGEGTADLWYKFEADGTSAYRIAETSDNIIIIGLYTADVCDGELSAIGACDFEFFPEFFGPTNILDLDLPAGTYYLKVRSFDEVTDPTYTIQLFCYPFPENDLICNAEPISCGADATGNTYLATDDNTPFCGVSNETQGVWYEFVPESDALASFSTCDQADFDSKISVYTAADCDDNLVCVDGMFGPCQGSAPFLGGVTTNSTILDNVLVLAGQKYFVLVHGFGLGQSVGSFTLSVTCEEVILDCPGLGNFGDSCADGDISTINEVVTENCECVGINTPPGTICDIPIEVDGLPYFDNDNNTAGFGDDYGFEDIPPLAPDAIVVGQFFPNQLDGNDVIYEYTPSEDQIIDVTVNNVAPQAGFYVFTGCPFESTVGVHGIFGATNLEIEALPVTAGVTYYIAIGTIANAQSTPYDLSIFLNVDDCPNLDGDFGDTCDDGDVLTFNDVITEDCECSGTPVIPGQICDLAIEVTSLPYSTSDNAINYFDDYDGSDLPPLAPDVIGLGTGDNIYLNGDDVVYAYTPAEDGMIDVYLNGHPTSTGLFVITGCPFESTVGYHTSTNNLGREIEFLPVIAGTTYYIVISTKNFHSSFPYTLTITVAGFDCEELEADFNDPCDDGINLTIEDRITEDCVCAGTPTPPAFCGEYSSLANSAFGSDPAIITDDIEVSGTTGVLTDLDVVVLIQHRRIGEVDVRLTSPSGTTVDLILDQCGNKPNINVLLDDDGPEFDCEYWLTPTLFGTFAPEGNLSDFNGEVFNGTWTIEVEDDTPSSTDGELLGWCLIPTLQTPNETPCDDAIEIIPGPGFTANAVLYDQENATASGIPQCHGETPSVDTWYSFEAVTTTMAVRVKGIGEYDIVLEVWDECEGNRLRCRNENVEAMKEQAILTNCIVGEMYYFRVYDFEGNDLTSLSQWVAVAHLPITKLEEADCNSNSYTTSDTITTIIPEFEFPITSWTYEFTELESPFNVYEVVSPNGANPDFLLNQFTQIETGRSYSVRVKASVTSYQISSDYGEPCEIIIAEPGGIGLLENSSSNTLVELQLYPNPNDGTALMMNLRNLSQEQQEVMVEVYDLYGKKVHAEVLGNNGSQMNAVIRLPELASGIYTVNVVVNEERVGARKLVIQQKN